MNTFARILAASLLVLGLAACNDRPTNGTPPIPKAAAGPISPAAIAAEAKGFTVGSEMNVRRVFVFFDPQCPHCAALWQAAKPLKSQARFVWIPVGLMNPTSVLQGATILAAADPVEAMDRHETSILAKQGGITPTENIDEQKAAIQTNTALMNRLGLSSIPAIVANHAVTGALVVREGTMPTSVLATTLGLKVPEGN